MKRKLGFYPEPLKPNVNYLGNYKPTKNDVIIDVGAYHGGFSYPIYKNKNYKFLMLIEPSNVNMEYIEYWFKENNVALIKAGLWCHKCRKLLFLKEESRNTLFYDRKKQFDGLQIARLVTLDSLTFPLKKIDFLKMDIEGSEINALLGAKETLTKTKRIAVASYHTVKGYKTFPKVIEILNRYKFAVVFNRKTGIVYGFKDGRKI